jgi:hypothetical protein
LAVQDRAQVGVGEPARHRRGPQSAVDRGSAAQLRQGDGFGHLRGDAAYSFGGGFFQPGRGAGPDRGEGFLGRVGWFRGPLPSADGG